MGQRCSCIKRPEEPNYEVKLNIKRNYTRSTYKPKGAQYICPQIEDYHKTWTLNNRVIDPSNEEINS